MAGGAPRIGRWWTVCARSTRGRAWWRTGSSSKTGAIITSAGVASGIDMKLALVEQDHGPLVVSRVAREMVIYLRRAASESNSASISITAPICIGACTEGKTSSSSIRTKRPHPSARADRGDEPAQPYPHLLSGYRCDDQTVCFKVKLQVARDLIDDPQRSVEGIAASCGFEDARQLRAFGKKRSGSPSPIIDRSGNRFHKLLARL